MADDKSPGRDRRLSIPVDFDQAIRAALQVKPPEKPKRKRRKKSDEPPPAPKPTD